MPNVFTYLDYRKYLADYYEEQKAKAPGFSYQILSNKAGFGNRGFIFNVIKGVKSLSKSSIVKLCRALKLSKTEADYFENLVSFNQADNFSERDFYYERLNSSRVTNPEASKAQKLRQDQFEFYSKWYHSVVRSLIDMHHFKGDYKQLAKMVHPRITEKQAKNSVALLEKLELIKKQADGSFKLTSQSITSLGTEAINLGLQKFHLENMQLAAKALQELPGQKRDISGLTLGISEKTVQKIRDEIRSFQNRIMEIANGDTEADRTYQLNFYLFPTSQPDNERTQNDKV
jgi:uncharacterized protein (TIGR02147 family)